MNDTRRMLTRLFSKTSLSTALTFSLMLTSAAQAEDLTEIFNLAANNDPEIRQARENYNAQHTLLNQGRAALLPTVTLTGSYSKAADGIDGTPPSDTEFRQVEYDWRNDFPTRGYNINLRQTLLNFEAWYAFEAAKKNDEVAALALAQAEQDLILRVSTAYFEVLRSQDNLAAYVAEEEAAQQVLEQTQERFDVGLVPITDVYDSQANYDLARVNRLVEENNLNQRLEALEAITGVPHSDLESLSEEFPIEGLSENIELWEEVAMGNNLAILSAEMELEASESNADSARAAMYPTIELSAGYGWQKRESASFNFTQNMPTQSSSITFDFELPLYSGGANRARLRQAYYTRNATEEALLLTQRQTTLSLRNAYRSLETDVLAVDARAQAITSAESALEATEVGAEVGTRNIVDVVVAQRTLYQALRDYADARYNYVINSLTLKQAAGTLSPEDIFQLNEWLQ